MDEFSRTWTPRMLSVLRIATGLLFLEHGTGKLLGFPDLGLGPDFSVFGSMGGIAGLFEFFGSILIVLGLFTRPVAFVLSGMAAVAYFMVHAPQDFFPVINKGELAALYCFVFLFMAVAGGGAWSLDAFRSGTGSRLAVRA
jgi:putative oxidoreductase